MPVRLQSSKIPNRTPRLGFVVNARKILILTGFLKHGFPREIA